MKRRAVCFILMLAMLLSLIPAQAMAVRTTREGDVSFVKAETVQAGKSYVIVSGGMALQNKKVEGISTSSIKVGYTLAGTPVTVAGDRITSEVTDDLIWDFTEGTSQYSGAYTGKGFFIKPHGETDLFLRRTSGSTGTAGLDVTATGGSEQYYYWATEKDASGNQALFFYSEKSGDYIFFANYVSRLNAFAAPGSTTCTGDWQSQIAQYPIDLYEVVSGSVEEPTPEEPIIPEVKGVEFVETDAVKAGESYVIVSGGKALQNKKVEGISTSSIKVGYTLAGTDVTVAGDRITSEVTDDMIWDFTEGTSQYSGAYTGKGFFIKPHGETDLFLRRTSGSTSTAGLDVTATGGSEQYYYWATEKDSAGNQALFFYSEKSGDYIFFANYVSRLDAFAAPGSTTCTGDWQSQIAQYPISLYKMVETGTDAHQHEYAAQVVAPTCLEGGYTVYTCECGSTYTADKTAALGHDFADGICTRCGAEDPYKGFEKYDIVFLSDLHNGVGGYNGLKQMMAELKSRNLNPDVLSHGGDYVEDSLGNRPDWKTQVYDVISGTERDAFPNASQVYTMGNHDWESGTFGGVSDKAAAFKEVFGYDRTGLAYVNEDYEIYTIGAQGETGSGGGGETFILDDIAAFDTYLASMAGSGKVVFLQTHWPAHSSFNFKQRVVGNSDRLIDTINKYADDLDVVWIWGHNHYEDSMRYTILQPGDQIMYKADTSGSTWGNPRNPQYKTIKFTYANAGCMNDMWYKHDGHNDTTESIAYRGPSACLTVAVEDSQVTFTYNRLLQENGTWTFTQNADFTIYNHNVTIQHPSTVVVERQAQPKPAELAIVTQPESFVGLVGETAKFAVEVNRTDVTYQWLWSNDGGKIWEVSGQSGCSTAEVSIQLKPFRNGQLYKVVVTDSTGATVESAPAKMSTPVELKVTKNPADVQVAVNEIAAFTVKAEGEIVSYQWMYSNNGGAYWSKSTADGATTASMTIAGKAFRNGQMYKCVVTDVYGNVAESASAIMTVG